MEMEIDECLVEENGDELMPEIDEDLDMEDDIPEEDISVSRSSRLLRKHSVQSKKSCAKDERNAAIKKVAFILQKSENEHTEDDKNVLNKNKDVIKEVKSRWKKRDEAKRRVEEFEEPLEELREKCRILAQAIAQSQHLVVYTGAGISTAARIPDYRGTNGIWTRLQQGKDIGNHDLSLAEPTYTHMALHELYKQSKLKYVVSQNCDGLHLRSGLPKTAISEVHGNMYVEVCKTCKPQREYWRFFDVTENTARYSHKTMRLCYICNGELIDTIVHFGERGSLQWPLNWSGASKNARKATTILCLGSSLKVLKKYPWLWQMHKPVKRRPNLYIVNLQWTPKDDCANVKINGKCDVVMEMVMEYLGIQVPQYDRNKDPIFIHGTPLNTHEIHTTTQPFLKWSDESDLKPIVKKETNTNKVTLSADNCDTQTLNPSNSLHVNGNLPKLALHVSPFSIDSILHSTGNKNEHAKHNTIVEQDNTIHIKVDHNTLKQNTAHVIDNKGEHINNKQHTLQLINNINIQHDNTIQEHKDTLPQTNNIELQPRLQNNTIEPHNILQHSNKIGQHSLQHIEQDGNIILQHTLKNNIVDNNELQSSKHTLQHSANIEHTLQHSNNTEHTNNIQLQPGLQNNIVEEHILQHKNKIGKHNLQPKEQDGDIVDNNELQTSNSIEFALQHSNSIKLQPGLQNNIIGQHTLQPSKHIEHSDKIHQLHTLQPSNKIPQHTLQHSNKIPQHNLQHSNNNQLQHRLQNNIITKQPSNEIQQHTFQPCDKIQDHTLKNNAAHSINNKIIDTTTKTSKFDTHELQSCNMLQDNNKIEYEHDYNKFDHNAIKHTLKSSNMLQIEQHKLQSMNMLQDNNKIQHHTIQYNNTSHDNNKIVLDTIQDNKIVLQSNNMLQENNKTKQHTFKYNNTSHNNKLVHNTAQANKIQHPLQCNMLQDNNKIQQHMFQYNNTSLDNKIVHNLTQDNIKIEPNILEQGSVYVINNKVVDHTMHDNNKIKHSNMIEHCMLPHNNEIAKKIDLKHNTTSNNVLFNENYQALLTYYQISNSILRNQFFTPDLVNYPFQTSLLYSGLHSIINPMPFLNEENNYPFVVTNPIVKVEIKEEIVEPTCDFCFENYKSTSCVFYDKCEPIFMKQRLRSSKLDRVEKPVYCTCCDYTTEEEIEADLSEDEVSPDKISKVDDDSLTNDSSKNKIQPGWFGKGYRKNKKYKKKVAMY